MGLSAGIVGLPNVGKSTIFNAFCNGKAEVQNYPFTTIDPNTGIIAVPDERMERISSLLPTRKVVPAFLELVDIAGLVKGASKGEGLGNQFLGHIKSVDAILHVVRCFEDANVIHVEGSVDPIRDIGLITTELMLADLGTIERGIMRVEKTAKSGDREAKERLAVFQKANDSLSKGIPARKSLCLPTEQAAIAELNLLTMKSVLYAANVDEDAILSDNEHVKKVREFAAAEGSEVIRLCGKIEAEIASLPENEQPEFLSGLGIPESGLTTLAKSIYPKFRS